MSNNTILKALEHLGYKGKMTGHGFRGLASTALYERQFASDHIKLQLAHVRGKVRGAYDHSRQPDNRPPRRMNDRFRLAAVGRVAPAPMRAAADTSQWPTCAVLGRDWPKADTVPFGPELGHSSLREQPRRRRVLALWPCISRRVRAKSFW